MPRNLELKVPFIFTPEARDTLLAIGARPIGVLEQRDTYFIVPHGRLKLRETAGDEATLIAYTRPDHADTRASDYLVVPVLDAALLLAALSRATGLRGIVSKRRDLWLWKNVRVHLDTVEALGTFLEFEAVISDDVDEQESQRRLETLRDALKIDPGSAIAGSYSDLLLAPLIVR